MREELKLRLAEEKDIENVFDLSNDPTVRLNSFHTEAIQWYDHVKWFHNKLAADSSIFYILEFNNDFAGYLRLDKDINGEWVVTIHIANEFRGKGLGTYALRELKNLNTDKKLVAYVKKENLQSQKLFQKANFRIIKQNIAIHGALVSKFLFYQNIQKSVIAISNSLYKETSLYQKDNIVYINTKEDLTYENLKAINPKYVFFPHWSYIIPAQIYENFNCIIFHMTDLPFGRGGSPLQNLIERGIYHTKISAIRCVKILDGGDIYLKRDFDISHGSASEIYAKAGSIVSEMIDYIIKNNPMPFPQQGEIVEFKRRIPEQSDISKLDNLQKIYDYIRMLDCEGYPKAFIKENKFRIEFSSAQFDTDKLTAKVEIKLNEQ